MNSHRLKGTPSENLVDLEPYIGIRIHIVEDALTLTRLARLGNPDTVQPEVNELIKALYTMLIEHAMGHELSTEDVDVPTCMATVVGREEGSYRGPIIRPDTKVTLMSLARAGDLPSYLAQEILTRVLSPKGVRIDAIPSSRALDDESHIIGVNQTGNKIGGPVSESQLWGCDPMEATASSVIAALRLYKEEPDNIVLLHLVAAPQGLKRIMEETNATVYVCRVDAGLTDKGYIKGAKGRRGGGGLGGMGERMTNSFV